MMMNVSLRFPSRQRGFTLIELLIAVAIVGILVRLAYPSYQASVRKARRADAKAALLDLAQREERYMAQNNIYTNSATNLGYPSAFPISVMSGSSAFYTIAAPNVTAAMSTSPALFDATATASTAQSADPCKNFILYSTGLQAVSSGATLPASECW
jgi:type IV pilus assembly protein PilE